MTNAEKRRKALLEWLPTRSTGSMTARQLAERVWAAGSGEDKPVSEAATLRAVQRDLAFLERSHAIASDGSSPAGWFKTIDPKAFALPTMDSKLALLLHMAQQQLRHLLPHATHAALAPFFSMADSKLKRPEESLAVWTNKVRVMPLGLTLLPPPITDAVLQAVSQALLNNNPLIVRYRRLGGDVGKDATVHPQGLVVRGPLLYLVCVYERYTDPRLLALHRMESATVLDARVAQPIAGFDLDAYIASDEPSYTYSQQPLALVADFTRHAASYLREMPVSSDQALEDIDDDWVRLSATVADTYELRRWLKSWGDDANVLEPEGLREEFAEMAENLAYIYELIEAEND